MQLARACNLGSPRVPSELVFESCDAIGHALSLPQAVHKPNCRSQSRSFAQRSIRRLGCEGTLMAC